MPWMNKISGYSTRFYECGFQNMQDDKDYISRFRVGPNHKISWKNSFKTKF